MVAQHIFKGQLGFSHDAFIGKMLISILYDMVNQLFFNIEFLTKVIKMMNIFEKILYSNYLKLITIIDIFLSNLCILKMLQIYTLVLFNRLFLDPNKYRR